MSLRQLFGPWVVVADADAEGGDENQAEGDLDGADPGFDFEEPSDEAGFDFDDPAAELGAAPEMEGVDEADPYLVDLTGSVFIAGLLHILHNTTSDLHVPLQHWAIFIDQLRQVTRMLSRRWSRCRLVETCFATPPQSFRKEEIESFRSHLYEGRWGSIWQAIGDLLNVMDLLRFAWSKQAFLHGRREVRRDDANERPEHSLKVDTADSAIRSDLFWAYCVMLDMVGECFESMARWGESCPCHSEKVELQGMSRWKRGRAMMQDIGKVSCPMRSCRAPCCAAGEHFRHLHRLVHTTNNTLLWNPCIARLSAVDRALVLGDFGRARQHVQLCLKIRLSYWKQTPWSLFGTAHLNAAVARDCARLSLALFESATDDTEHHPLTLLFCAADSIGGVQLRLFASGERSLDQLPFLETQVAKLKFAPVAERWIESRHSLAKRSIATAPHVTAAYIAFHGVQLPLRGKLTQTPDQLPVYALHCSSCRNPVTCLKAMGLWHHPRVVALLEAVGYGVLNRQYSPALTEILYHVDAHSLHAKLVTRPDGADGDGDDPDDDDDGGGGGNGGGGGGCGGQPMDAQGGNGVGATASSSSSGRGNLGGPGGGSGAAASATGGLAASSSSGPGDGGSGGGNGGGSRDKPPQSDGTTKFLKTGSSGGSLHDELWCKAAFDFFCSKVDEGGVDVVYSLGPQLSRMPTDYLLALSSVVDPQPSMPEEDVTFEFDNDCVSGIRWGFDGHGQT